MRRSMLLLATLSLPLAGCYSMRGPPQVINARGILPGQQNPDGSTSVTGALEANFRDAAASALAEGAGQEDIDLFMRSGFTLVYARCGNYFTHAGRRQMRSRLFRDTVAPIVSLLTGVITLHDFGENSSREQNLLEIVTLGSNISTATLDVYDRNFLFGADNIDAVREMTFNALSAHSRGARSLGVTTFEQAAVHLIDNQLICSPPHILSLARESIARSNMEARDASGVPIDRTDGKEDEGNGDLERVSVRPQ